MKRIIWILLSLFMLSTCAYSDESALVPVLEGNVVIDANATPNYIDCIELSDIKEKHFKTTLRKEPSILSADKKSSSDIFLKQGSFTLESKTKQGFDSDTLMGNIKRTAEVKYNSKFYELSGGYSAKFQNSDATRGSQSIFVNNKFKTGKRFSLEFDNYLNPKSREYTQAIGINYKAKYLKGANFGILGGTTFSDSKNPTYNMYFSTDFYFK